MREQEHQIDSRAGDLHREREKREQVGRERAAQAPRMWAEEDFNCLRKNHPPVPLRHLIPTAEARNRPPILFVHGGGWAFGSINASLGLSRKLASVCDRPVVSVGYRLAPEYPFPAALEDVSTAINAIRPQCVVGASAGATLALQALSLADKPATTQALLFYGIWKQIEHSSHDDQALTVKALAAHLARYAPGQEHQAVHLDTSRLPKNLGIQLVCGEGDILFDSNRDFAAQLGEQTSFVAVPERGHGFLNRWADDSLARVVLDAACREL
ncbi:MAG: alpha/beta hydrolase [Hyphomicrobiales bacterium]